MSFKASRRGVILDLSALSRVTLLRYTACCPFQEIPFSALSVTLLLLIFVLQQFLKHW